MNWLTVNFYVYKKLVKDSGCENPIQEASHQRPEASDQKLGENNGD